MRKAHNIRIKVFAYNEEKEEIRNSLLSMCPESVIDGMNKKKLKLEEEVLEGKKQGEKDITAYRLYLEKEKYCNDFLENLLSKIKDDNINSKLCKRIDKDCKCYIRLDKNSLLKGEYRLVFGGSCFHIRIALAVFPKRKNKAEELMNKTIESLE